MQEKVVLFLDSITRYARALRDVALAAGEAPARRGYPASVLMRCPNFLNAQVVHKEEVLRRFILFCWRGRRTGSDS